MTDNSMWQFSRLKRIVSGRGFCVIAIVAFSLLTVVEGTWGFGIHRSPVMWVTAIAMLVSLGLVIFDSIREKHTVSGTLSHIGMFLLLFGTLWSAPFIVDVQMFVSAESEERNAFSREGSTVSLPFSIRLEEFCIDYYDDEVSPKQYTSTLMIEGNELRTSVNHPCHYKGYYIYQSDFDRDSQSYSVLKLVRDPWLPLIFLGFLLLTSGAILSLKHHWNSWYALAVTGVVALIFGVISLARINFGTLMPALRSLWFIPHIALYMLAYSSLGLAFVIGCISHFSKKPDNKLWSLSSRLFHTASSLLLLGMICGAVWAKVAWGDWWTWDAKECWAAVTWLLTLTGTHLPCQWQKRDLAVLICMLLSFIAMQVAWYGVDLLPAAQYSLHTYR